MKTMLIFILFMMIMGCNQVSPSDINWSESVKKDVLSQIYGKFNDTDYKTMHCVSEDPYRFSDQLWGGSFYCYSTHMSRGSEFLLYHSGNFSVVKDGGTPKVMLGTKIDLKIYKPN